MKNFNFLFLFMLIAVCFQAKAQQSEIVFSDNFDSYTAGTYLGSVTVPTYGGAYAVWKAAGTGNTANITATASNFYSGTQSAVLNASKNNFSSIRKTIAVTSGHSYTFSAWTNCDVALANKPSPCQIAYQFNTTTSVKGSSKDTLSAGSWHKQSITFTAGTSENVDIFLSAYYYSTAVNVYNDDWLVIDNTILTDIREGKIAGFELIKTAPAQFELKGNDLNSGKILSADGRLVKTFTTNSINLSNLPKGIYVLTGTSKQGKAFTKKFAL